MRRTAAQQGKQLFRAPAGMLALGGTEQLAQAGIGGAWAACWAAIPPCLKRTIHLSPVTRLMPNWRQSAILLYFWLSQALMNISRCCMTFVCLQGMGISEGAIP